MCVLKLNETRFTTIGEFIFHPSEDDDDDNNEGNDNRKCSSFTILFDLSLRFQSIASTINNFKCVQPRSCKYNFFPLKLNGTKHIIFQKKIKLNHQLNRSSSLIVLYLSIYSFSFVKLFNFRLEMSFREKKYSANTEKKN